jgi:hypothetical protein
MPGRAGQGAPACIARAEAALERRPGRAGLACGGARGWEEEGGGGDLAPTLDALLSAIEACGAGIKVDLSATDGARCRWPRPPSFRDWRCRSGQGAGGPRPKTLRPSCASG